jgi:hypothetical protein
VGVDAVATQAGFFFGQGLRVLLSESEQGKAAKNNGQQLHGGEAGPIKACRKAGSEVLGESQMPKKKRAKTGSRISPRF